MEFRHTSVLLEETVDALNVRAGGLYIDMTLGGGGHSNLILERGGRVIGIDRDEKAIENAAERFRGASFTAVRDDFSNVKNIAQKLGIGEVDGALMDLGVSSPQLDEAERGFSYNHSAPLDMRMDQRRSFCAADVVNTYSEQELFRVISGYGEERWARRVAKFIVKERERAPILTTDKLVDVIKAAIPAGARKDGPHPAKRTFQAIRIEVNGELDELRGALCGAMDVLKSGGRISVITFHSLEDRIVKDAFALFAKSCTCPKTLPVCVCGGKSVAKVITKHPVLPSHEELLANPRARSAKLRVCEKI